MSTADGISPEGVRRRAAEGLCYHERIRVGTPRRRTIRESLPLKSRECWCSRHIDVDTANAGLDKRILGLEDENSAPQQRVKVLEGQLENSDRESMGKLQAAAKSMGFDLGVLAEEILRQARLRQQKSS